MTDKLEADIRRGKQAAIILDDPVLKEAMDELEKQAIEAAITASPDELLDKRAEVVAFRKLRRILASYVTNGRIASRTLVK